MEGTGTHGQYVHNRSSLPVELLVYIFDEFQSPYHNNISPELQACRQACKQFDEIILSMCFKKGVDVGYRWWSPPLARRSITHDTIVNALNRYPLLASDIRNLFYLDSCSAIAKQRCHFPQAGSEIHDAVLYDELKLDSPLLRLSNVHTITVDISFLGQSLGYNEDSEISVGLRSLLGHYLRAGTLTTLFISSVSDIPIMTIIESPSLVTLSFFQCTFSEQDIACKSAPSPAVCKLKHLSFHFCEQDDEPDEPFPIAVLTYMLDVENVEIIKTTSPRQPRGLPTTSKFEPVVPFSSSYTFQHLSEMKVTNLNDWRAFCPSAEDDDNCAPLFPKLTKLSCAVMNNRQAQANLRVLKYVNSLSELSLLNIAKGISGFSSTDIGELLLSAHMTPYIKTLKVLSLDWAVTFRGHDAASYEFPLNQISSALESITRDNILESINLSMTIYMHCEDGPPFIPNLTGYFSHFTDILCLPRSFRCLRQVSLKIHFVVHNDMFGGEKRTEKMLKRMLESALLRRLRASRTPEFSMEGTYELGRCHEACFEYYRQNG
ncbi:hypothetical protein CVT24_005204 [Panaeolus cyanescens]|uniref:F-box domain-containing protein n=1 Tax=Panaeolus cyanescens TaxID=181874 RepID=A0A409Y9J0_9AGAR|nr:hypothetical protein CVT24_005204 [Panaeolus cyanescens]